MKSKVEFNVGAIPTIDENGERKFDKGSVLHLDVPDMERDCENEIDEIIEREILTASNLKEFYAQLNSNGIEIENDGSPVKIKDVGRSGVVILTNYGTIATTENLPDSIREEIEAVNTDSPEIMNRIESALKSKEIDFSVTNSIGVADRADGKIDIEHENPETDGHYDTASNRKENTRDILEGKTNSNIGEEENERLSMELDEDTKRRLRLEFEEKYGNSTRNKDGREIGE